jgi:hypothetical protein
MTEKNGVIMVRKAGNVSKLPNQGKTGKIKNMTCHKNLSPNNK